MKELKKGKVGKSSSNSRVLASYPLPSQAEYSALMDLYQATGGANWYNNSVWSTADPNMIENVDDWQGVHVDLN